MTRAGPRTLFRGGPIRPMKGPPLRRGVLLCRGRSIDYVGPEEALDPARARGAEIVELDGRPLLPGFCDSHVHLVLAALQRAALDLRDVTTTRRLTEVVAEHAAARSPGGWITGHGWERSVLLAEHSASPAVLDAGCSAHPVFLVSKDWHSAWLNTLGLERLQALPRLPAKSVVERMDGRLTGLVFEEIFELREMLVPAASDADKERLLPPFVRHLWSCGITALHTQETRADFELVRRYQRNAHDRVRVLCNLVFGEPAELRATADLFRSGVPCWLSPAGAKIFLDGSFGSLTAAVSHPYAGTTDRGILNMGDAELLEWLDACAAARVPAVLHAIGDRAVEQALRCLEQRPRSAGRRPRLEPAQLLSERILARHDLRPVVFSGQPSHMWTDREIVERNLPNPTARRWAYPFSTLQERGSLVVFGSDAPVEGADPWRGIEAAVTRMESQGVSPWIAEERITLTDALAAHTSRPASIHGYAFPCGVLEPGHFADLVILERDPWEVLDRNATALRHMRVDQTFVDGQQVYSRTD